MKIPLSICYLFFFLLISLSASAIPVYQKAETTGKVGDRTMKVIVLLEDQGLVDGLWQRTVSMKALDKESHGLLTFKYTYKPLGAGKYEERMSSSGVEVVGQANLIGKIDSWVELQIQRPNICDIHLLPKQSKKTKTCRMTQKVMCENLTLSSRCTETVLLDKKVVHGPLITLFNTIDQKTYEQELANLAAK
jgi:hypothetical protein